MADGGMVGRKQTLTSPQLELLGAVRDGHVADRYHLRGGWATRRTDVRSGGRGGGMGTNVTAATARLAAKGLAKNSAPKNRFDDWPWRLTPEGTAVLDEYENKRLAGGAS